MPHMASVSVGLWVGIGSRYEPPEMNGVCHFIEHMLFKGTSQRSAKEISQAVEGLAGYLRDNYLSSNLLIVAAGRLKHRHVVRTVARYARLVRSGARPQFAPARNEQSAPRVHLFTKGYRTNPGRARPARLLAS